MRTAAAALIFAVVMLMSGCATWYSLPFTVPGRRMAYVKHHHVAPDVTKAILAGEIAVGMTKAEVKASWGDPCLWCYGTTRNSWGDTWDYDIFGGTESSAGTIVYFDETGRVTAWSQQ